jgi:hypothetical protein
MRRRRICLGMLCHDAAAIANGRLTSHRCLEVVWRGLTDWCQPFQFADMAGLQAVARLRLEMAGLKLVSLSLAPAHQGYSSLLCEVERLGTPHARAVELNQRLARLRQENAEWRKEIEDRS